MGRTIPSWRMVVEAEIDRMRKFGDVLLKEDKNVFNDLIGQCRVYASAGGAMASAIKEVPLIFTMLFAQHKRLLELERQIRALAAKLSDSSLEQLQKVESQPETKDDEGANVAIELR